MESANTVQPFSSKTGTSGSSTAVPDVLPGVDRVVTGDIDGLQHGQVLDIPHACSCHDAQYLGEPGVHPGPVEGCSPAQTGLLHHLGRLPAGRMRMVAVAMVTGDPVGRRDDVDAALEQRAEQVNVGPDAVEVHDVRLGPEHVFEVAGSDDPEGCHSDDLPGVPSDLLGRVAVQADQLKVRVVDDAADHLGADVARGELGDTECLLRQGDPPTVRAPVPAPSTVSYG